MASFRECADGFAPATPALLEQRSLLRRVDSKFVLPADQAESLLTAMRRGYAAVDAAGKFLATYQTQYFDTDDLRCFHDHRRGKRIRHKVRVRHYLDRELSYLEVKTRRSELLTTKERVRVPFGQDDLGDDGRAFVRLHSGIDAPLVAGVRIDFGRLMLISLIDDERVTLDVDLEAVHEGQTHRLHDLVVVEVKQRVFSMSTPVMRALQAAGARPRSMSKYVVAMAHTRPDLRMNRLLPDLRGLRRRGAA